MLQSHLVCQDMHVLVGDSRLCSVQHSTVGAQDCVVNYLLVVRELAIGRVGAGDVGAESVVFRAHVKENNVPVLDSLIVGCSSVTVVEDGPTLTGAADAVVANVTASANGVTVVQKGRLALVFLDK